VKYAHELKWGEWYAMMRAEAEATGQKDALTQYGMEHNWCLSKQPYYNVWPAIIPPLVRLNLDLSTSYLKPPMPELLVRLPVERNPLHFEWQGDTYHIQTILMCSIQIRDRGCPGVGMWIDFGERMGPGVAIHTTQKLACDGQNTLEWEIENIPREPYADIGVQMPPGMIKDCLRLCCTLCLLEQDPEVVTADVLSKDKAKFAETGDPKFIAKARKRGKVGWDIGREMTVSPHYRVAHSCLFWTGKGRTVPMVKIRKGTVVHRKQIEDIPTGHLREGEDIV
jgi:hypothetical protein